MMNEVVKYSNYMNNLYLRKFKAIEYDLLMTLCAKLRDKDTNTIVLSFIELKNIIQYTKHTNESFIEYLKSMNRKLMSITCEIEVDGKIIMFVLFHTFEIDPHKQELTISVNKRFKFILNELIKNFTFFDLTEFIKLNSKYSKCLYRLLKQFKTTGMLEIKLDDFRGKFDCPKSYSTKYIMDKIIKPSLKELQNYFQDLQCTVKYEQKRGKPVSGYIFTFKPEQITKPEPKEIPAEEDKPFPEPRKGLTQEEVDRLANEFDEETVDDYIQRTKAYKCCNYATIREWILEDRNRHKKKKPKSKNQFNNFMQREVTKKEMDELELKLLRKC